MGGGGGGAAENSQNKKNETNTVSHTTVAHAKDLISDATPTFKTRCALKTKVHD